MGIARELAELGSAYNSGGINQFRNRIINGDMRIDQRNAGSSVNAIASGVFPVDRFIVGRDTSAATVPTQRSTVAPSNFTNSLQVTVSTGASPASGDDNAIFSRIEGFNVADFGWGTSSATPITLSFWVRSSVTGTYGVTFANSAANRCFVSSYVVNSANTWEQKTITIAGDTSGTWLTDNGIGLRINWDLGVGSARSGSASSVWGSSFFVGLTGGVKLIQTTGATFYITGVQLEKGSTATSFDYRPYGTELALCQRYYQGESIYIHMSTGNGGNWNNKDYVFPVQMRANATITFIENIGSCTALTTNKYGQNGRGLHIFANVGGYGTFTASAEL